MKLDKSFSISIDVSQAIDDMKQGGIFLDPVTGEFKLEGELDTQFDKPSNKITAVFTHPDYQEQYEKKQQALADIVRDGDGLRKEEVRDLVLTANKAVWNKSSVE